MIVTSSGIIRNEDKPRTGIISSNECSEFIYDEIENGIDISYEEFHEELLSQDLDENEIQEQIDMYQSDSSVVLFGDAWVKVNGKYSIDQSKEYAATYDSDTNIISVEWSKHTKHCGNTSPCYVMSNGDGPCGDLSSSSIEVLAYSLPKDLIKDEEHE